MFKIYSQTITNSNLSPNTHEYWHKHPTKFELLQFLYVLQELTICLNTAAFAKKKNYAHPICLKNNFKILTYFTELISNWKSVYHVISQIINNLKNSCKTSLVFNATYQLLKQKHEYSRPWIMINKQCVLYYNLQKCFLTCTTYT